MSVMENWTQTTFRYRDDDGSETTATWRQNAGVNDTLSLDTTYRMRFLITGTHTGGSGSFDFTCGFQYNVDAAGWNNITTTSANVKAVASADTSWTISDDDVTTEQLAGAATFVAGKMDETGTCTAVSISDSEESEFELVFQLLSSELSGGEAVQIRCVDSGSALATYTLTPSITAASAGGTINTVTIDTGQSAAVNDSAVELRERNSALADSHAATDTDVSYKVADRVSTESIKIEDLLVTTSPLDHYSRATRYRARQQSDAHTVTDPAPTATYVPGSGAVVNTVTITGANNYAATTDALVALRLRDRAQAETSGVTDATTLLRERTRSQVDDLAATDTSLLLRERSRAQVDTATASDVSAMLRLRDRGQADAIDVDDVNSQWIESNEQQVETIDTADDSVELRERNRVATDSAAATDSITAITEQPRVLSDALAVTDDAVELRLRDRESLDSIVVLDDKNATYVTPGSVTNNVTLQDLDSASTTDASLELRERNRSQSDALDVTDSIGSPTISTTLSDSLAVTDNAITLRLRDRAILDTSVILDDKNATYVTDTSVTNNVTLQDLDSVSVADSSVELRERNRQQQEISDVIDAATAITTQARQQTDSIDVTETQESIRERLRLLSDSAEVTDSIIVTTDIDVATRTLTDQLSVTDSITATAVTTPPQFIVSFGVEELAVDHGLQLGVHSVHGIKEETS